MGYDSRIYIGTATDPDPDGTRRMYPWITIDMPRLGWQWATEATRSNPACTRTSTA